MNIYDLAKIKQFLNRPKKEPEFTEWLSQSNIIEFLKQDNHDQNMIIYSNSKNFNTWLQNTIFFIDTILLPKDLLKELDYENLNAWQLPNNEWSVSSHPQQRYKIKTPLTNSYPPILEQGETLIFHRSFAGVRERESYFEISEKFLQIMDLHYMPEYQAWCKINEKQDIEKTIQIFNITCSNNKKLSLISIQSDALNRYCQLTNNIVIKLFHYHRYKDAHMELMLQDSEKKLIKQHINHDNIYGTYETSINGDYCRGAQFIFPTDTTTQNIQEKKEYIHFIVYDESKCEIIKKPCLPHDYKNNLPYDKTLIVFFNPEVLLKYKNAPENYTLTEYDISIRARWVLYPYYINTTNQIYTSLSSLYELPYHEQLYWKQFNEKPIHPNQDNYFPLTFYQDRHNRNLYPTFVLKEQLYQLHENNTQWWQLKNVETLATLLPVFTTQEKEWDDSILILNKLLIEGLDKKELRLKAESFNAKIDNSLGSLKIIKQCLIAKGYNEDDAYNLMTPWHEVYDLRTIVAHTSGDNARQKKNKILRQFGSYKKHFHDLCKRCLETLEEIIEVFEKT